MKSTDLKNNLYEIRRQALEIISGVMSKYNTSEIDCIDVACLDNPTIILNGEKYRLVGISHSNNDILFEVRNMRCKTYVMMDEDVAADDLIKFAEWVETYEEDIEISVSENKE